MDRIGVFIDYENMHRGGHELFARPGVPTYETALDPLRVARRIVSRRRLGGELTRVHVYRGRPLPQFQPEATGANDRLAAAWRTDGVVVARRDLKYTIDAKPLWFPEMLRLQPPRRLPFCHFLTPQDFLECRDDRGTSND
jgi:hypothetical protein